MDKMAYFNNAATTFPKPEEVYLICDEYSRNYGMSVSRGNEKSNKNIIDETRELLTELFNCSNKKVVFTHSATESLNIILQGLELQDDYNVYVTPFEHNAVMRVLHHLQKSYELNIITLAVDKNTLSYNLDEIEKQFLKQKPNITIMSHVSNVCGLVTPIEDICKLAYQYNSINIIDMCQSAGLVETDLSSDIYDFSVFAGHKTLYAPYGVGGFLCKESIKLKPLLFGGTGVDSENMELPNTVPERFEVGSQNITAIVGLNASLKWIKNIGIDNVYLKEQQNAIKLLKILNSYDNIQIIGRDDKNSTGVFSCVFDEYSSDNVGQILYNQGIEVRTGLHCAPFAHKFLGTFPSGTVRFSVSYFTSDEDFKKLNDALEYIYENSY